tara:strand:- start:739 stop:1209 length:471 start_codon:yes stop_codon:yes gene_type:complete
MEDEFINKILINEKIIHKVINLYCDNSFDKKDYYQEILLQSWKSFPNFRSESKFSTWLYKISLNTVLSLKSKKTIPVADSSNIEDISSISENQLDSQDQLIVMLSSLNDIDRSIISLYLDGYQLKEISDMIGLSNANIKVKIHRIKKSLIAKYKHD